MLVYRRCNDIICRKLGILVNCRCVSLFFYHTIFRLFMYDTQKTRYFCLLLLCKYVLFITQFSGCLCTEVSGRNYTFVAKFEICYDYKPCNPLCCLWCVIAGLPKPNGDNHAGEIASMSLHLLSALKNFKIHHRPGESLKLRIGRHW